MTIEITYISKHYLKPGDLFKYNLDDYYIELYTFNNSAMNTIQIYPPEKVLREVNMFISIAKLYLFDVVLVNETVWLVNPIPYNSAQSVDMSVSKPYVKV
jgi:hypothetical protein